MLSAVIRSAHGYPAFTPGGITGTPEVRPSQSSRTKESFSQYSNAYTGYGPNCFTHGFWRFNLLYIPDRCSAIFEPLRGYRNYVPALFTKER